MGSEYPSSVEDIFMDYSRRKSGILKALTDESEELYAACNPEAENLCLYGLKDGSWVVGPPAEEVPPELPEPCLGINFARDGMPRREWLALLAVHSDTWLLSVAFYYAVKLESQERMRLFKNINSGPTLFEIVTERRQVPAGGFSGVVPAGGKGGINNNNSGAMAIDGPASKRPRMDRPHSSTVVTGRLLTEADVTPALQGRQAELYWPDDQKWYLVEIQTVNVKARRAKIVYASGEFEDVDLAEILRDSHMALL